MSTNSFAVITENDESSWNDLTGRQYHFPKRYLKFLRKDTKVVYYKGKLKVRTFKDKRLSNEPHYFGITEIDYLAPDDKSTKGDYFAFLKNYKAFDVPVAFREGGKNYVEQIPENQAGNYWRNAVRPITQEIYLKIINAANQTETKVEASKVSDFETVFSDGEKKVRYGTYYERKRLLRAKAIELHGLTCQTCGLNFEKLYGEIGKGFIHVHHVRPLALHGKTIVDPKIDLVVVCPNCHAMLHRPKDRVLTLKELIAQLNKYKK